MLNEGVLNLTLNESPEPKRSVIDPPAFEAGAGLRGACTGAGLRGAGAGTEIGRETAGLLLNLVEPEFDWTALDTTEEIWGEMLDTTWFTMSLELKVDEEPDVEVVSGGGARGATGRLLLLLTALDTVEEMRGWMLLTTVLTISLLKLDDPELNPLLLEELKPLLEELNPLELNPESENEDPEFPENDDPELPEKEDPEVLAGLSLIST
jgi:hypothetical protein